MTKIHFLHLDGVLKYLTKKKNNKLHNHCKNKFERCNYHINIKDLASYFVLMRPRTFSS